MEKWILEKKLRRHLDFSLIVISFIISIFGSINIYSATHVANNYKYFTMQIIYITLSLMISYIFLLFDYSLIAKFSYVLYWVGVVLLLYTDIAAKATKGAQSWITILGINIEPGEIIKIGLILIIAKLIDDMRGNVNNLKNLIKIVIYMCIPVALILKEPNYGLAVICICIVFGMLFISGLNIWRILTIVLVFIGICALMLQFNLLKTYQLTRITSFLDPQNSSTDSTFQVDNSILAIGSGGFWGKGFLKSTQVSGGFIPEANTDMIFSVLGEEWGMVGAGILLILYIIMLIKILRISKQSKDTLGKLICVGYFSALTFSIYQNIGMTIRRAPVAGITLPFMSYGGSSILTNFIILALILNVGMRRKKINF